MITVLSNAQEAQAEGYRTFAKQRLEPIAAKLAARQANLQDFLKSLAENGYLGINVPKEYGGKGGNLLDLALLAEQLGRFDPSLGLTIGGHAAVIELLKRFGTDEQKARHLPMLASGESIATLAFSEPAAGTDFAAVQASVSSADKVSGKKSWVVSADIASLFAVLAKDADALCLLIVSKESGQTVKLTGEQKLMGLRSAAIGELEFSQASALRLNCDASDAVIYATSVAKVILSAAGLGMMEQATEIAVIHARQRQQFGTNIGTFQGVQWKLADMGADAAGCRLQLYRAAWAHDGDAELFIRYAAMCKAQVARCARVHTAEAVQVAGAQGLLADGDLARFYDDAKVLEIAQGTSEFQKILLVKELNI